MRIGVKAKHDNNKEDDKWKDGEDDHGKGYYESMMPVRIHKRPMM